MKCNSKDLGLHQGGAKQSLSLLPQYLGGWGAGNNNNNRARAAPVFDGGYYREALWERWVRQTDRQERTVKWSEFKEATDVVQIVWKGTRRVTWPTSKAAWRSASQRKRSRLKLEAHFHSLYSFPRANSTVVQVRAELWRKGNPRRESSLSPDF